MERLLQEFETPVVDQAGTTYRATDVETTQPNAEAVLYWASGLSDTYFDGALERALVSGDSATRRQRLSALERAVLNCFRRHAATRLVAQTLFDELRYEHADVVRALEDLEKQGGLLRRATEEGNDWVFLTDTGVKEAGVQRQVPGPENAFTS